MNITKFYRIYFICAILGGFPFLATTATSGLQTISDDDLVERMKSNEFLIVLFSKGCPVCDKYESELLTIQDDFKNDFSTHVVKVMNSHLVRLYNPSKEPAVILFRHGVPILYPGVVNADEIFAFFDQNRSPVVKELSDENFEHLTQASTGATTGDWFVLFYNRNCIDCQRLTAVWEAVGATLRNQANVAKVDKDIRGSKTAKRFDVRKAPEFIFIRQGKFYRYEIPKYDVKSFVAFAQVQYKNARAEKIKVPASPFDELVSSTVAYLKSFRTNGLENIISGNSYLVPAITIIGFILVILILKCCTWRRRSSNDKDSDEKKKKSK